MSDKMDPGTVSMIKNLQEMTGRSLEDWVALVRSSGPKKHKEIIGFLKDQHGLTYGYANLIALTTLDSGVMSAGTGDDLLEQQYAGEKAALRPIYEAIIAELRNFGDDVELSPKKGYVSVRRNKQFAILQPSTKARLDVGMNLKGEAPQGRLEASGSFNAMVSHRVRLESIDGVDAELVDWLRRAYEAA